MRVAKNPNWKLINRAGRKEGFDFMDDMRGYRDKNFVVVVEPTHTPIYEDEASLKVTHNGYQWLQMNMNKREAKEIVKALRDYFKI